MVAFDVLARLLSWTLCFVHMKCRELRMHRVRDAISSRSETILDNGFQVVDLGIEGDAREHFVIHVCDGKKQTVFF